MNAQMYDPQYVAARLAARRVPPEQPQERPMARRHNLTNEEMAELRELIAGDADEMALGAFAQRCNIHGSSMKAHARAIRRRLAEEAEEAVESVADAPPVLTVPIAAGGGCARRQPAGRAQRAGQCAAGGADWDGYRVADGYPGHARRAAGARRAGGGDGQYHG
jgi:DNA-binding CsgD family transcriptional regulator